MHHPRRWALRLGGLATAGAMARPLAAQTAFPNGPVRVIVPYPPGGATDPVARVLAQHMQAGLGQPVIVENRPGAAGEIGTAAAIRARPDGQTLLFHTTTLAMNYAANRDGVSYDARRDVAAVAVVAEASFLVVVHPRVPVRTMQELLDYARANPGRLNAGSSGPGSSNYLATELLQRMAGITLTHVPFRGGGAVVNALVAGDIEMSLDTISGSGELVRAGRLRALAVTGPQRSALLPDVPTVAESGVPGYESGFWMGFFAPAQTPPEVIARLDAAIRGAMATPEVQERLRSLGFDAPASTPDGFGRRLLADIEKWEALARQRAQTPR